MTQSKNTTNILFKNTVIPAIGLLVYAAWGFKVMYPGTYFSADAGQILANPDWNGFLSWGWGLTPPMIEEKGKMILDLSYNDNYTYWTDYLFQGMFAATAATIVSGAVAERVKLIPFLIFSILFVGVVYPIIGSWHWGTGFLAANGFYDFAGSTLVHSVGGWGALAGAIVLGPRIGKYVDGKVNPIPASNLPMATVGVFLLWLGWFGFNGGSILSADAEGTSFTLVTTCLAAAAGALVAPMVAAIFSKKADLTFALNGILAGLVGITAGANVVTVSGAIVIGAIAGAICVFSVLLFDSLKIDDPVGAISVHLVCGIWGTLAVGIFSTNAEHTLGAQLMGIGSAAALAFPAAFIIFYVLKVTTGIRVPRNEEIEGLDVAEHGMNAYRI